jgi:hypothetical protein
LYSQYHNELVGDLRFLFYRPNLLKAETDQNRSISMSEKIEPKTAIQEDDLVLHQRRQHRRRGERRQWLMRQLEASKQNRFVQSRKESACKFDEIRKKNPQAGAINRLIAVFGDQRFWRSLNDARN